MRTQKEQSCTKMKIESCYRNASIFPLSALQCLFLSTLLHLFVPGSLHSYYWLLKSKLPDGRESSVRDEKEGGQITTDMCTDYPGRCLVSGSALPSAVSADLTCGLYQKLRTR